MIGRFPHPHAEYKMEVLQITQHCLKCKKYLNVQPVYHFAVG